MTTTFVFKVCRVAAAVLVCGAVSAAAQTPAAEPASGPSASAQEAAPPPPPPPRPWPVQYAERRFDENWAPIDWSDPHKGSRDFFDKMKAVKLNDSGSVWANFGGSIRGRLAYQSTVTFGGPFEFEPTMWTVRVRGHADVHFGQNFRVFSEYIYSNSSIQALVDTFGAPSARLGNDAPNKNGDALNLFGEYQGNAGGWQTGVWGGRRELLMGNQRIISPGNWLLNRHTFDGGGAFTSKGKHRFEGFVVRPMVPIPDRYTERDEDTVLSGGFYTTHFTKNRPGGGARNISFEPYLLNIQRKDVTFVQGTADENRFTLGALSQGDLGSTGLDFEVEGMYQYGRYETPFDRGIINAYAWVAKSGYRWVKAPFMPRLVLGLEYASGDKDPDDTSLGTFDPLYPLAWNFYGFHAAFDRKNFVAGSVTAEGLWKRVYFRTTYFPVMKRAQAADGVYNSFNEIQRRPIPQSRGGDTLDLQTASMDIGQQLDFGVFWQPTHHWQFYATYLHFYAGQFYTDTATAPKKDMNGVMMLTQFAF
jgi:hypothetical protein